MKVKDCYVIVHGNPMKELNLTGPFERYQDADHYAHTRLEHVWYWIKEVAPSDTGPKHQELADALMAFTKKHVPGCFDVTFYNKYEWNKRGEDIHTNADLTMTFEGGFYHVWNHGGNPEMYREFCQIIKDLGYDYEQGFMWSLHFFKEKR
jgi:hypothetical protein